MQKVNFVLDVARMKTVFTIDEFLERAEDYAINIFNKEDFINSFCLLLLADGSSCFTMLESQLAIEAVKLLSVEMDAVAYVSIHEAHRKDVFAADEATTKLIHDLDFDITLLSGCEHIFIMVVEFKKEGVVKSRLVQWNIEKNETGRRLSNRQELTAKNFTGMPQGIIKI